MNVPPARCSRAFTLIELLAVVAIIATLAALLLPSIQRGRGAAMSASCVNNLRQIGAAFQLYAADNNGLYPAPRYASNYDPTNPSKNPHGGWMTEIYPYLGSNRTSYSNSDQEHGVTKVPFCPEYYHRYSSDPQFKIYVTGGYGMSTTITGDDNLRFNAYSVSRPSSTILVGDSTDYHLFVQPGPQWYTSTTHLGGYESGDPKRHNGMANYLFVDGHIAGLKPDDALKLLGASL
ncbi:DUF1559 domain-containing protein [soil metagenome]